MRIIRDYALGFVLAGLFLIAWGGHAATGWKEFQAEQAVQGRDADIWGDDGYIWNFSAATLENWQSEFLQLLTFVVLTAYLLYRGSPESRDGDDEIRAILADIRQRLSAIEAATK